MNKLLKSRLVSFSIGAVILLGIAGCDFGNPTATPVAQPTNTVMLATATSEAKPTQVVPEPTTAGAVTDTPLANAGSPTNAPQAGVTPSVRQRVVFANYVVPSISAKPSLKPYTVASGMGNVSNASDFELPAAAKALIEKNSFAAQFPTGQEYKQFYQLYEEGRYAQKPVFVTTDSVLHVYHLIFDKLLRSTETKYLISDLMTLTGIMLKATQAQYDSLKDTPAENAAKRNLAYFTVAERLLNPDAPIPDAVRTEVSQELQLIEAHAGMASSPVMNMGGEKYLGNFRSAEYMEDYGQYNPRGHYTRSEDLKRYFKAMMWYGRMTFRLKSVDETRSALLMTQALETAGTGNEKASTLWGLIYEPTTFFVGGADDLTYLDYKPVAEEALGSLTDPKAVVDDAKIARFQELAKSLAAPRINSMFVYITEDKEDVTKGLRIMGQRFTLDEYVFGQLIWRNVGDPSNDSKKRWLPKGLDLPAAFGSQEAYKVLDEIGETNYMSYTLQMDKVRGQIKALPVEQWTENLYWSWLYTFHPLLAPKASDSGYPSFMTNDAWTRKDLNTVLGSWTELKHDTILYAKQVMAELGGGPSELPKGYVEPEPEFYARIVALVAMTRDGLLSRGLIEKPTDTTSPASKDYNTLTQLHDLALDLKTISEKELEGKPLTEAENTLIQYYGGTLEHITIDASDAADAAEFASDLNDQDAAVVADVASSPGGDVLTEGTGRIMEIYVVAPIEGKLVMARGGIYSQYEFIQPTSNRLTDEQWRQRLDNKQAPPLGDWKSYVAK